MKYPVLNISESFSENISVFGGINEKNAAAGEFSDALNMENCFYPAVSARAGRRKENITGEITGALSGSMRVYTKDNALYINSRAVSGITLSSGEKQLVFMGAKLLIFPDKIFYNTANSEYGYLENSFEKTCTETDTADFSLCSDNGTELSNISLSDTEPENPEDKALWIDGGELKVYSKSTGAFVSYGGTLVKISSPGINSGFKRYDAAEITCAVPELCGTHIIKDLGDGYILITGIIKSPVSQKSGTFKAARRVPDMDYIAEFGNRLWGCKFGIANGAGAPVNEIYASALGDPENFNKFEGTAADSYRASLGSDGEFTGAAVFGGKLLFFKENFIHKIFGSYPQNFEIQTMPCEGAEKGSFKCIKPCGTALLYKGCAGVYAYTGGAPALISENMHFDALFGVCAGAINEKYYISQKNSAGDTFLYVYDKKRGTWQREDGGDIRFFAVFGGELYFAEINGGNSELYSPGGDRESVSETVNFSLVTGRLAFYTKERKYVKTLNLKMQLSGSAAVYIKYDSDGGYTLLKEYESTLPRGFSVTMRPKRCDHFEIKIAGSGGFTLYSLSTVYGKGSER